MWSNFNFEVLFSTYLVLEDETSSLPLPGINWIGNGSFNAKGKHFPSFWYLFNLLFSTLKKPEKSNSAVHMIQEGENMAEADIAAADTGATRVKRGTPKRSKQKTDCLKKKEANKKLGKKCTQLLKNLH